MSFVLSLLIALPLFAAPLVYLATKANRQLGIYLSLGLAAVVTAIAGYVFWQVYANTPAIGQYALQE